MPRTPVDRLARLAVAGAFVVAPLLGVVPAAAAAAGLDCTAVVVDAARVLGPGTAARAAVTALKEQHPDIEVYVRTYRSLPGADPGAQEQRLERGCATWREPDGTRRATLVSVIVDSGDHRTGLYYGSEWTAALDSDEQAIQTTRMNPLFQKGDFDSGVAAGLSTVRLDLAAGAVGGPDATADPTFADGPVDGLTAGAVDGTVPFGNPIQPGSTLPVIFIGIAAVLAMAAFVAGIVRRSSGNGSQAGPPVAGIQDSTAGALINSPVEGMPHHHHGGFSGGFSGGADGGTGGGGGGFSGGDGGGGGGGSSSW